MIPRGVEVFVCLQPIDLRWGFDRLSNVALSQVGREARSGVLVVFFGRRQEALKVLFFDGSGMCLFYKRLDRGRFRIPSAEGSMALEIEEHELDALLDGIEVLEPEGPRRRPRKPRTH